MSTVALLGAIEVGLIFSLVAIAIYISFRVLNFPDLTVDGSFPLGAAVSAVLISDLNLNPFAASLASILSGAVAGAVTGYLNVKLRVIQILAGILVMTALYSLNLRIMGRPNIALLGQVDVFTAVRGVIKTSPSAAIILTLIFAVTLVVVLLVAFFASQLGLAMRGTGANPRMARANGVADGHMIILGLAISNGVAAFAGSLFAQSQGYADVTMGIGTIVVGLAALIVGEGLMPARTVVLALSACIGGSVLYRLAITLALNTDVLGLQAQDLSLVTAVLVAVAVVAGNMRRDRADRRRVRLGSAVEASGLSRP